jgi:hypothetical protein
MNGRDRCGYGVSGIRQSLDKSVRFGSSSITASAFSIPNQTVPPLYVRKPSLYLKGRALRRDVELAVGATKVVRLCCRKSCLRRGIIAVPC